MLDELAQIEDESIIFYFAMHLSLAEKNSLPIEWGPLKQKLYN